MNNYELGLPEGASYNPMQLLALPHVGTTDNVIMAAPTASGKSLLVRMFGNPHLANGGSIVYVAPMKALVEEKRRSWSKPNQSWESKKVAVITGDYNKTSSHQEDVDSADIIVITPESLASRMRRRDSPKSAFLKKVKLLVIDEAHLISEEGRGANLEAALMDFTQDFPDTQVLLLSATMPNYRQIGEWVQELTGRPTQILYSTYRPNALEHHFMMYTPGIAKTTEAIRINMIVNLVLSRPEDTFLICVYKKTFGQAIYKELAKAHVASEFHYGNLSKIARDRIEKMFEHGHIRALVATKTMTVGVDSKADCTIITDMKAGGREIPASEIQQGVGRAGRHKSGHAFYLVANDAHATRHMQRVQEGEEVISTMKDYRVVATHFLGAIYRERITVLSQSRNWFKRSFAAFQGLTVEDTTSIITSVIDDMRKIGMVWWNTEDDKVSLTNRGRIAAQLLMNPYYVADLCRNFRKYFALPRPTDTDLACALGECSPYYATFITTPELNSVPPQIRRTAKENFWKPSSVYWYRLTNAEMPDSLRQLNNDIYNDLSRAKECVRRLAVESEKWNNQDVVDKIFVRAARGVTWEQAGMILEQFTTKERTALHRAGIYSVDDARRNTAVASAVLDPNRMAALGIVEGLYGGL